MKKKIIITNDSLEFLKKCLKELNSMSQEEFDKRCRDSGIDEEEILKEKILDDFKIII